MSCHQHVEILGLRGQPLPTNIAETVTFDVPRTHETKSTLHTKNIPLNSESYAAMWRDLSARTTVGLETFPCVFRCAHKFWTSRHMQFMCFQQLLNPCLHATAVQPCYPCCTPATPSSSKQRFRSRVLPEDGFKVVLAVSPIGRLRGVAGYHTSVLVGGRELCFGISGISTFRRQLSHQENPDLQLIDVGVSCCSYKEVRRVLRKHFLPGTYDILRKNCNSFTDCALYMMCEQRLAWHFRGLDAIGRTADANGVLRSLLPSRYRPNPLSVEWQVEDVIEMIESECTFMHNVSGTDEMEDGQRPDRKPNKGGIPRSRHYTPGARKCALAFT